MLTASLAEGDLASLEVEWEWSRWHRPRHSASHWVWSYGGEHKEPATDCVVIVSFRCDCNGTASAHWVQCCWAQVGAASVLSEEAQSLPEPPLCLIVFLSLTACLSFTKHETVINRVDRMWRPSTRRDRPTDRPTNETFLPRFNCFCLSCASSINLNCSPHSALLCALLSEWSYSTLHRLMGSIDHQRMYQSVGLRSCVTLPLPVRLFSWWSRRVEDQLRQPQTEKTANRTLSSFVKCLLTRPYQSDARVCYFPQQAQCMLNLLNLWVCFTCDYLLKGLSSQCLSGNGFYHKNVLAVIRHIVCIMLPLCSEAQQQQLPLIRNICSEAITN